MNNLGALKLLILFNYSYTIFSRPAKQSVLLFHLVINKFSEEPDCNDDSDCVYKGRCLKSPGEATGKCQCTVACPGRKFSLYFCAYYICEHLL